MKILVFAIFSILFIGSVVTNQFSNSNDKKQLTNLQNRLVGDVATLKVSVLPDKKIYKSNEEIKLQALLTNTSNNTIYIYGILTWGYSASFSLQVLNSEGKEIQSNFTDDSVPPPPNDKNSFVRLYPQHFLGTYYSSSIKELNLSKPGKYEIYVEYHSPVSETIVQLSPFWGREKNVLRSESVFIEVTK